VQIENSFTVGAPPDRVFAFLLDVNRVVACVPGAELSEVVDSDTFKGKVRIKVGPVTVSYNGTAHMTSRDEAARAATLEAEGRETTGSGSARATTTMTVTPEGDRASVRFVTDFTVVGRVAQFGRGIMEDVSRKLVGQMADCIRTKLEAEQAAPAGEPAMVGGGTATVEEGRAAAAAAAAAIDSARPLPHLADEQDAAVPLDALALARSVATERIRATPIPARLAGIGAAFLALVALLRLRGRRRRHRRG
jgi:carbon monoxide dehydrogenase subunit G